MEGRYKADMKINFDPFLLCISESVESTSNFYKGNTDVKLEAVFDFFWEDNCLVIMELNTYINMTYKYIGSSELPPKND